MKKSAFTLGEVLLVLVIVGVISVLALQTVKSQTTKFNFSCYHFFRDLKIAVGHMAASTYGGSLNSFSCERALESSEQDYETCMAAGIAAGTGTASDTYILDYRTGQGFCQGLANVMSTASATKCSDGELNNATLNNIYGNISSGQTENFKMLNRFLVYVSKRVAATGSTKAYRIISVDINGNRKPNMINKDIISFAIFDNGEVLPLGTPAESSDFFMTVIKIRNILPMPASNKDGALNSLRHPTNMILNSSRKPLSFKEAYCKVYGSSANDSSYCSGYTSFSESFKLDAGSIPITICTQSQYNTDGSAKQKVNGQGYVAECEVTVIKPQVSKFFPVMQDVYSSKNNVDDKDSGTNDANQIYKY